IHTDELGRQLRQLLYCFRPAKLDHNVFSLNVSEVAQPRAQDLYPVRPGRSATKAQEPNPEDSGRLLRPCRERPAHHPAEQRDELAPSQLIVLHSISDQPGAGYLTADDQQRVSRRLHNWQLLAPPVAGPHRRGTVTVCGTCSISASCSHLARRLSGPALVCMRECAHLTKTEQPRNLGYMQLAIIEVTNR